MGRCKIKPGRRASRCAGFEKGGHRHDVRPCCAHGPCDFTGAAVYVNVAEQPARLLLDDRALLAEWKPSYKRGAAMQASIALIGCVLGLVAWGQTWHTGFLVGAVAMVAPWPWTLLAIKPTNDALLATDEAGPPTRVLIEKW